VSALHEIIQSKEVEIIGELPAISDAMMERRRESVARMGTFGAALLQRRKRSRWIWVATLLGLAGAGVLAHVLGAL